MIYENQEMYVRFCVICFCENKSCIVVLRERSTRSLTRAAYARRLQVQYSKNNFAAIKCRYVNTNRTHTTFGPILRIWRRMKILKKYKTVSNVIGRYVRLEVLCTENTGGLLKQKYFHRPAKHRSSNRRIIFKFF